MRRACGRTCKVSLANVVGQPPDSRSVGQHSNHRVVNSCASWASQWELIHILTHTNTARRGNITQVPTGSETTLLTNWTPRMQRLVLFEQRGMGGYQDIMWPRWAAVSILSAVATIGLDTTYSRIHNTGKKVEYASAREEGIIMGLCFSQYLLRTDPLPRRWKGSTLNR